MTYASTTSTFLAGCLLALPSVGLTPQCAFAGQSMAEPSGVRISYAMANSALSLGEPVAVTVRVENLGNSSVAIDAGADGSGAFAWSVSRDGGPAMEYPYKPHPDVTFFPKLDIPAKSSIEYELILNERTEFQQAGRYIVTVRHLPTQAEGTLSVLISNHDAGRISERCRQIVEQLGNEGDAMKKDILLRRLAFVRDPVVVPYLIRAANYARFPNDWAAHPLSKFDTPYAIEEMLNILGRTKGATHELVRSFVAAQSLRAPDAAVRNRLQARLEQDCVEAEHRFVGCRPPQSKQ